MRIVEKYGGTSLMDTQLLFRAAERAAQQAKQGNEMILVVSAQGHTTDLLARKIRQVCPQPSSRETDAALACGEQLCAALMAIAIEALGQPAVSLTGWQAGIITDSRYGDARILALDRDRILRELKAGRIVVVTGFQGMDEDQNITTLGRGGSDTTAVALAAFLKAQRCRIYTDVDGVYDRDPNRFPDAVKFPRIGYRQMLGLIRRGAQVLHERSVETAMRHGICVEVLSSLTDAPGTLVGPD